MKINYIEKDKIKKVFNQLEKQAKIDLTKFKKELGFRTTYEVLSEKEAEGKLSAYAVISIFDVKKAKELGIEIKGILIESEDLE